MIVGDEIGRGGRKGHGEDTGTRAISQASTRHIKSADVVYCCATRRRCVAAKRTACCVLLSRVVMTILHRRNSSPLRQIGRVGAEVNLPTFIQRDTAGRCLPLSPRWPLSPSLVSLAYAAPPRVSAPHIDVYSVTRFGVRHARHVPVCMSRPRLFSAFPHVTFVATHLNGLLSDMHRGRPDGTVQARTSGRRAVAQEAPKVAACTCELVRMGSTYFRSLHCLARLCLTLFAGPPHGDPRETAARRARGAQGVRGRQAHRGALAAEYVVRQHGVEEHPTR